MNIIFFIYLCIYLYVAIHALRFICAKGCVGRGSEMLMTLFMTLHLAFGHSQPVPAKIGIISLRRVIQPLVLVCHAQMNPSIGGKKK